MDAKARLRSFTSPILFFSVLAILLLVGVIQYQWFSRSAAVEIEGTIRGLEGGLRQSVLREFQRFGPVASELEEASLTLKTEAETRALLLRTWSTYGPDGPVSNLVSIVGYSEGNGRVHVLSSAQPNWAELSPPDLQDQDLVFRVGGRGEGRDLFVGVDIRTFFATYVFPSLLEQYPGATLEWEDGPALPPGDLNFNVRTYFFNPFTALFSGASVPRTLRVGIPRMGELPFRPLRVRAPSEGPTVRSLNSWTLRATLPPEAPVLGIESRLAWNWLGSTLLLVVLAGTFGIILRQSARLADLRRREREFVASVSHELRTPLTVIRSAADNVAQGIVAPERQARYGQLILDQSLRLGRMIEEMLAFAQAEVNSPLPLVQAPLVFETWLEELRPPLEALASAREVHLSWDVAGVPPSGLSDPAALRLILENLVINAINHAYPAPATGQAPRSVRVTLRYLVPDRLELTVDDDGRGISPQEAKKVFEPFYRDQVSRNHQEKGSGLGLFLARHQARRMGGELKLETPWRRVDGTRRPGCRFTLSLPFPVQGGSHGR